MENIQLTPQIPQKSPAKTMGILVLILILLLVGGYYALKVTSKDKQASDVAETPGQFVDEEYGTKIAYDTKAWKLVKDDTQRLQLEHVTGSCQISYGLVDMEPVFSAYGELRDTDSTYSSRFDEASKIFFEREIQNIYIDTSNFKMTYLQQRPQNGDPTNIIAAYIPHFPSQESSYSLLLHQNQKPITQDCVKDFIHMLSGIDLKADLYSLTANSEGYLTVKLNDRRIGWTEGFSDQSAVVVFTDMEDKKTVLANLDSVVLSMQLAGGKLYFINNKGLLSAIDLQTKQVETIPLPAISPAEDASRSMLNTFFIYGNRLFYLTGKNCNEYMARCDLVLHEFNLDTKQDSELADQVSSRDILGLDTSLNVLQLRHSEGDAGCSWRSYEEYNFNTKVLQKTGNYSYCLEESDDGTYKDTNTEASVQAQQKIRDLENRLKGQLEYLSTIQVKNGVVLKNQTDTANSAYDFAIRHVQFQ